MVDDIVLDRCQFQGLPDIIQWSNDGYLSIIGARELLVMKPKKNTGELGDISDIFTLNRLTGTLKELPNIMYDTLTHDETIRVGQIQNFDLNSPTEVRWSSSGISSSKQCMMSLVLNTFSAYILENSGHNNWTVKFNLIDQILKFDGDIDLDKLLTREQSKRVRIHSIEWTKPIKHELISLPIWPLNPSSIFFVCTESSTVWAYRINPDEQLERVSSFRLPECEVTDHDTYIKTCKISDWILDEITSKLVAYIALNLSSNELLLKKMTYDLTKESLTIGDDSMKIHPPSSKLLSYFDFQKVDKASIGLVAVSTNTVTISKLTPDSMSKLNTDLLNSFVSFNSCIQYCDSIKDHHIVLTNQSKDMIKLKIDWTTDAIEKFKFDYSEGIDTSKFNSPLIAKLNSLRATNKFTILGLRFNPSNQNIALVHSIYHPYINAMTTSQADNASLSIVPLAKNTASDLASIINVRDINSINYSPSVRIQNYLLLNLDEPMKETAIDIGSESEFKIEYSPRDKSLPLSSTIQKNLILSDYSEKIRLINLFGTELNKNTILNILASIVVKYIETNKPKLNDKERLVYYSYLRLLGTKISDSSTLVLLNIKDLDTTESFETSNECQVNVNSIKSLQGHTWSRCSLTLLPLFDTRMKVCNNCGSKFLRPEKDDEGTIIADILDSLAICVYCGYRFNFR